MRGLSHDDGAFEQPLNRRQRKRPSTLHPKRRSLLKHPIIPCVLIHLSHSAVRPVREDPSARAIWFRLSVFSCRSRVECHRPTPAVCVEFRDHRTLPAALLRVRRLSRHHRVFSSTDDEVLRRNLKPQSSPDRLGTAIHRNEFNAFQSEKLPKRKRPLTVPIRIQQWALPQLIHLPFPLRIFSPEFQQAVLVKHRPQPEGLCWPYPCSIPNRGRGMLPPSRLTRSRLRARSP